MQAFYAEIYQEAEKAVPGPGHKAIAALEKTGKLQRHYTLNVDGLADMVGLSTWHPSSNSEGNIHSSAILLFSLHVCPDQHMHSTQVYRVEDGDNDIRSLFIALHLELISKED